MKYTNYDDVNTILDTLLMGVKEILKGQFIGMYLYGSLSSGDFDPKSSDIDFVVVTESFLPDKTTSALEALHKRIWASGVKWASKLEGSYIPKDLLRRHDPNGLPCPTVNEGKFYMDQCGSDWIIQRHVIRESGVVLKGPDPKTLIDFITPDDIRRSVLGVLRDWWFPMLENPKWLREHGSDYHAFAVISMCRALHALRHGIIVSKPVAAKWAQKELGEEWSPTIEQSLAAQSHDGKDYDLYNKALDLIRLTLNKITQNDIAQGGRMITYREYQDKDWTEICQIHDRARPDELVGSCDPRGFIPIEQDEEVEELKNSRKFVACSGEQVVGFVGVDEDYLAWLYIHPDHYGKGIGRELLRMGLSEIGENAWTIVLDDNHKAISLYESEGFQEVKRFAGDNNGYPCTCLRLERVPSSS